MFPADAVTLHLSSMPSRYLSPSSEDRIRQVSITSSDARDTLLVPGFNRCGPEASDNNGNNSLWSTCI